MKNNVVLSVSLTIGNKILTEQLCFVKKMD